MKYAIVAGTWASFSRAVAAAAIGTWLAFAVCPVVFAADGPQAAAAAKESMEAFIDYAKSLARSGGRPDYSKSPVAEHFRRIFDAETLAALPPPQTDWTESEETSIKVLATFGAKKSGDTNRAIEHNISEYENEIATAMAFVLRLRERAVRTGVIIINSLPAERRAENRASLKYIGRGFVEAVITALEIMSTHLKPQNARLMMAAIRVTVADWAPYASPAERKTILDELERARAVNVDAGIDDAVTAVAAKIRSLKN